MDKEDLLYRYFSNELTTEQQKSINQLLKNDLDFKKQFEFERDLKLAIKYKENLNLKAKLKDFEDKLTHQSVSTKSNIKIWAIAASIALLLSLGWLGYDNYFKVNYENLYSENFRTYPNTAYTITRGDMDDSSERQAFVAYEAGNFQAAIDNFEKISDAKKDYIDFYKGQSYLNLNNYEKATTLFKKVITEKQHFTAESHWYLALIYIKEKDKNNAISNLQKLIENYKFNQEKATALLNKLS